MFEAWRFLARRAFLGLADGVVTLPMVRRLSSGPSREEIVGALGEFRPTDRDSVLEMMAGRYLLASRLVDTHGVSPFAVDADDPEWSDELRGFSWLRHFRDGRDSAERQFARTLTLDWISREGRFDPDGWTLSLTARRVLNWLRHYNLLIGDGNMEQSRAIARSLGQQVQSLKVRGRFAADPADRLLAAIALAAVALCDERRASQLAMRMRRLIGALNREIDADGLHRSRSARLQLQLLVELETLRQGLHQDDQDFVQDLDPIVEDMHRGLDAVSLGTGEPAYFNGTGQLPHDLVVAVQVQSTSRFRSSGTAGGYGRLLQGKAVVVADGGEVPPLQYAAEAHASALAFEFSYGTELVVGNCGPAPATLAGSALIFRQGLAHSGITINGVSTAVVKAGGPLAGRLRPGGPAGEVEANADDESLVIRSHSYEKRFGATVERRLMLVAEGKTLVGQDRLIARRRRPKGRAAVRFHLALGTTIERSEDDDVLRLRLASGAVWTFLWEGAELRIEDSVRQSSYFGFHRIKQIVLEAPVAGEHEIAWVFTLDENRAPPKRTAPKSGPRIAR